MAQAKLPMKTITVMIASGVLAVISYVMISTAHGAEISKAEIVQTLEHMKQLTADSQEEAAKAKTELFAVQQEADTLSAQAAKDRATAIAKTAEARENAKERDVILYAFALALALYCGTFFAGAVMREFPTPWNLVGASACYLLAFGLSYFIGRVLLHALAGFIP